MAKDPTTDPSPLQDKMILLAQLKRYDEKIKQKIDSSSGGFITSVADSSNISLSVEDSVLYAEIINIEDIVADGLQDLQIDKTGVVLLSDRQKPIGLAIDPKGGITATSKKIGSIGTHPALLLKLNIGKGVKLNPTTGALEANVDGITIGVNSNTGRISARPTEKIVITNQPTSGSVTAYYNPGSVCIHFDDVLVTSDSKTLVGNIPSIYAPSTAVAGTVLNGGSSQILSAYAKIEPDGSIYINPLYTDAAGLIWTGTLTYLI